MIERTSNLISNPKEMQKVIENYIGIQTKHQSECGRIWFMRQLLHRNVFPHEVQVIAWKTLHGYNWQNRKYLDVKTLRQCNCIVNIRKNGH